MDKSRFVKIVSKVEQITLLFIFSQFRLLVIQYHFVNLNSLFFNWIHSALILPSLQFHFVVPFGHGVDHVVVVHNLIFKACIWVMSSHWPRSTFKCRFLLQLGLLFLRFRLFLKRSLLIIRIKDWLCVVKLMS